MDMAYKFGERIYEVSVDKGSGSFIVKIDGHLYRVDAEEVRQGYYTITFRGHTHKLVVSQEADRRMVFMDGEVYQLNKTEGRREHKVDEPQGDLKSPIAGKVVKVQFKVGDTVEKGQTIIIMEAMKMEYEVKAPQAGTIKKINFEEGAQVETGEVLVEMEEGEE